METSNKFKTIPLVPHLLEDSKIGHSKLKKKKKKDRIKSRS